MSGSFTVRVRVKNFTVSCALFGNPVLHGYGHWHLNLDTTTAGAMGMGGTMGLSGTTTIRAFTAGLKPGSTDTPIALLAGNLHVPLMPLAAARAAVRIGR